MLEQIIKFLGDILPIYNLLFAMFIVFAEKRSPASTWAWLMVVFIVPYAGSFLYLLIGFESRKYRTFRTKAARDKSFIDGLHKNPPPGLGYCRVDRQVDGRSALGLLKYDCQQDLVHLNYFAGGGAVTMNNDFEAFFEGAEKFERLFEDIRGAKSFIHLQYYILRNDKLGARLIDALAEKAAEGIEVKLLVDGMGTSFVPKRFYKKLLGAGGRLAVFLPPRFIRMNFRNHRKLAVIDGEIGYIGGLNVGDEYLGGSKRFGHWRDAHIRISGDAVKELEQRFIVDWNHCARGGGQIAADAKYFPETRVANRLPMQIVSSGPDTAWPSIHQAFLQMMMDADESIYIATPYFVPDDAMLECLRISALAGLDVRIMIPKNPDHLFVYWASASYMSELLLAGAKCYEYDNGFLHSKLLIVDNKVVSVGTANMDVRSFKLNFEVSAFIFDETSAQRFTKRFIDDIRDCRVFNSDTIKKWNFIDKIKESVARLISPLL